MQNWTIHTIADILPEEFYTLVDRNREHIAKTLPVTLSSCADMEKTTATLKQSAANQEKGENYYYFLRNTDINTLIGYTLVKNIDRKIDRCELAYFVDKDFQGKGIITKAVEDLIAFCFGELQMNKIIICTSLANHGSQRIALKHGFKHEGILREEYKNSEGQLEDIMYFGLLKSDYINEK